MSELRDGDDDPSGGFRPDGAGAGTGGAGLAACVNILPAVNSVYTWKGVPHVDKEQQLLIKTTADAVDALWEVLRARHPYDMPEFMVMPIVDGSEDYLAWVEKSVGPKKESVRGRRPDRPSALGQPSPAPARGPPSDPRCLRCRPRCGSGCR